MKKILITGVLSQPFGSWAVATQSDDGITWDTATPTWSTHDAPTAIATDGTIATIANGRGYVSTTSNFINYSQNVVYDGLNISGLLYSSGSWIAAGHAFYNDAYGPYTANSDIAQIHKTTNPTGLWEMIWIHPLENSFIYQCKKFINAKISNVTNSDVIVTVGCVNNEGDAWYSLDNGSTWQQLSIPIGIGRILSINYASVGDEDAWYWGCNNKLFKSSSLQDTNWYEAAIDTPSNIVDMVSNDSTLLCAGQPILQVTQDGFTFNLISKPGYITDKVQIMPYGASSRYFSFLRSTLTQYTYIMSDDAVTWTSYNNNITVTGSTIN